MLTHTHHRLSTAPRPTTDSIDQPPVLLGQSVPARRLRTQVERIAPYLRTALLVGEAGAGKEQIARALHAAGPQSEGPFVACSATVFAEALHRNQSGGEESSLLDSARGGTLYLRRVDELAYPMQANLQKFLVDREATRMGGSTASRSALSQSTACLDVRVIASSRRDLRTLSSVGQFRAELYAKLSVLEVSIPALRERTEDIQAIAQALLERTGMEGKLLSSATVETLKAQDWPGNLRDLEQALMNGAALASSSPTESAHLSSATVGADAIEAKPASEPDGNERLETVVQRHVLQVLTRCRGNKLRAAELLGISRSTLYRMLDSGSFAAQTHARSE